jgi:transcription antitermination protein NusB
MKPAARHRARRKAVQALYQMLLNEDPAEMVIDQHFETMDREKVDANYFNQLVLGVSKSQTALDELFLPHTGRALKSITPIELCVLRLACFELTEMKDVPFKVVINEALELTKCFGTSDGFKFVNGVLDKTAKDLDIKH